MYIKSYSCKRFAGLSDESIEFDKGLNVILGPNESGKSTIINGIHSTLFKNIRLNRTLNVDKDFIHRYMPKPDGDFIDGNLVLSVEGNSYKVKKEWGVNEVIQLTTPDGNIIKTEDIVKEELSKLLLYGEGTYSNIVFAKQKDLKASLTNIMENSELTSEINSLLRKTMMELDGVSIENLQNKIETQLEIIYKRWDKDKNYPMNNKGINNPYKNGLGEILESYYEKENLKLLMEKANETEEKFENICDEISELQFKLNLLKIRKEELEKIEGDINKRLILDEELKSLNRELEDLVYANKEWPRSNLLLSQHTDSLLEIGKTKKALNMEKENSTKLEKKKDLERKIKNIEDIDVQIDETTKNIKEIPEITKNDIEDITKIQNEILTIDTTMKAGVMMGRLNKSDAEVIWITKDLGEKEKLEINEEFKANGLISIVYEDKFELEIKTGEFDFKELKQQYDQFVIKKKEELKRLEIKTIEEAKLNLERLSTLKIEKTNLKNKKEIILDGLTMEELLEAIKNFEDIQDPRDISEIEKDLKDTSDDELDLSVKKKTIENQIDKWIEKYIDEDNLLDIVIEKRTILKVKEDELDKLAPLPERFGSAKEFQDELIRIKTDFEEGQESTINLREEFHDAKNQLLDTSYEEIHRNYIDAEEGFNRSIKKGENLLKVQKVFNATKENLDKNPMESLVDEFSRVLALITDNRYKTGNIEEDFKIKLENPKGEIPVDLLSAGTHDSVVLALRFALLKHIFQDRKGYVILDDCLVDLDPMRKEQSVALIKDFAEENQVIFTTCDPETAKLLGGSLIELQ